MMCEVVTEQTQMIPLTKLPLFIAEPRAWYFGPWGEPGHYLHDTAGRYVWNTSECPFADVVGFGLDGHLAPVCPPGSTRIDYKLALDQYARDHSTEYPQGQFLVHHRKVVEIEYTIAAWWDRTQGDPRPNSNACLIVEGRHHSGLIPQLLKHYFPTRFRNLEMVGRDLRPVPMIRNYDPNDIRVQFGSLLKGSVDIDRIDDPEFS